MSVGLIVAIVVVALIVVAVVLLLGRKRRVRRLDARRAQARRIRTEAEMSRVQAERTGAKAEERRREAEVSRVEAERTAAEAEKRAAQARREETKAQEQVAAAEARRRQALERHFEAARKDPDPFLRRAFKGVWEEERNLADPLVVAELAEAAGLDSTSLIEAAGGAMTEALYALNLENAVANDVFGSPAYVLGGEVFWGQDRLDFVSRALTL